MIAKSQSRHVCVFLVGGRDDHFLRLAVESFVKQCALRF